MKRKSKWILSLVLAAAVALTLLLYVQGKPPSSPPENGLTSDEIQFQAETDSISNTVEVKGKSTYRNETIVYAPFSASVLNWRVDEGQRVEAGDPLFELDANKLSGELRLAKARFMQQQLELKIIEAADAFKSSETESDNVTVLEQYAANERGKLEKQLKQLEMEMAELEINDKSARLNDQQFIAPEAGIFLFVNSRQPERVEQDEPVGKIVDLSQLQLICEVSEFEVFKINEDMAVTVRIDALPNETIPGRVVKVAKFSKPASGANAGSAKFEVTIELAPHDRLIAGLSLTGKIVTDSRDNVVVVPTIAVQRENDQHFVYIAGGTGVEKRPIRIGLETADKTEILEGVAAGETVVLR